MVRLSSHKKESKIQQQIIESQKVFEAFGSNNLKSCYGYYGEIQFNERGRMIGAKTLSYFLDKTRVTGQSSSSSAATITTDAGNFNIFYYLLAGVSPEEKAQLQLINTEPSQYNYLSKYKKRTLNLAQDSIEFEELKKSLKSSGFRKEHIGRIIQLVATILHLGNLTFLDPVGTGTQEAAFVKNTEQLEIVADFLGLDPHALENVLTFKTTMIRKDITTLILNAEQASLQRDELCQVLYSLLFSWIIERVNSKTCQDDFNSFIGILDFPGYNMGGAFNELCVNIGNERILHYLEESIFDIEPDLFRTEGISVPDIHIDSTCIDLLSRPKGICDTINTMTDQSKRTFTDANIMDSLVKFNTSHPAFSTKNSDTNARRFVINHYDGNYPLEYSTDGFVTQNNSQISVDFVSLFKGGMDVQPSWNSFVVDLFANVKIENHPKHNAAIIAARQSAKPTRAPSQRRSTRRKGGLNDEKQSNTNHNHTGTILTQIQSSLDELITSFEEAKLWTVLCILPKKSGSKSFDVKYVQSQLELFKLPSLLQLPTIQYVESYFHHEFLERYSHLFQDLDTSRLLRSQCETAAGLMNWTTNNMCTTQNKVNKSYLFIIFNILIFYIHIYIYLFRSF